MSEGKKLLESVDCKKGITLNSQLVDLLSILDNTNISIEEQDEEELHPRIPAVVALSRLTFNGE